MNTEERNITARHLLLVWAMALTLRVIYLILTVLHLGAEQLATYAADSEVYLTVARHILSYDPMGDYAILRVGPGYGLIIAGIQTAFGANPLWVIAFNVVMGSLAPVLVYFLAFRLTRIRIVALLAGLISAVSMTSVALSCNILTDQPFFTVHVAGMVCLAKGFTNGRIKWFIASGLLAGAAVFIRSAAMYWPFLLLLIPLVIPVPKRFPSRWAIFSRVTIAAGIILVLIAGWSYRNDLKHGLFTFGTNGMLTIRSCLGAKAIVENTDENDLIKLRESWEGEDGDRTDEYVKAYGRAKDRFEKIFSEHPGWVTKAYLETVWSNVRAGNHFPLGQIPALKTFWEILIKIHERWLGIVVFFASLAGIICLFIDRRYFAAMLLGLTFAYFTLLSGFSFWQGSRIYFPAEMAWSILIVYAGYRIWPGLAGLIRRLSRR